MRGPDPRMIPALPMRVAPKQSMEQQFSVSLLPKVVPHPDWVARMKAVQASGGEVTPPADDEQDVVIGIRCEYLIPSDLAPQSAWPVVGMDLGIELGRINLADLKGRVHAALEKDGNSMASRVVPQRSGAA